MVESAGGPVQPVERPIICNPYDEPTAYWVYDEGGEAKQLQGRRRAGYWYRTERVNRSQLALPGFAEEQFDELPLVNRLREDVKRWRDSRYEGATPVTRELLRDWGRDDRPRRLFFCQREAAETAIYLAELRLAGKRTRFSPAFTELDRRELLDTPAEVGLGPLLRLGCKMATGAGKTVVMAMLIAWAFCNRGRNPSDERFPSAVLVCCPNLTVKERLQVLRPDVPANYYETFDLVPATLRPLLSTGKVLVTNWHLFAPESEHVEGGKSYVVVNKGEESPEAFARRVLGDLADRGPLLVFNDEGHHAYRPAPLPEPPPGEDVRAIQAEREEATVWVSGLDRLNLTPGIRCCVDFSATPFYIAGSGYVEGKPFPWLVSSTHLQAIEFEVARQVVTALTSLAGGARLGRQSRHGLFPQVLNLVLKYVERRVDFHGCHPCELGHQLYVQLMVERLLAAIEPDEAEGEPPLLPILNRYKPIGTTAEVGFKTTRACVPSPHSQINQVAADTQSWEQAATFRLEEAAQQGIVACYARNDHLGFLIPYEYLGVSHAYEPDFLVRLGAGRTLILEVKGYAPNEALAKHGAARRWVSAVNNWGELGRWDFLVCHDPQTLVVELAGGQ